MITEDIQRFWKTRNVFRHTPVHLLCLVLHDNARKVNGLQHFSESGVSGPILPVEEVPPTNRIDKCNFHRGPVVRTLDPGSLLRWNEHSYVGCEPRTDPL